MEDIPMFGQLQNRFLACALVGLGFLAVAQSKAHAGTAAPSLSAFRTVTLFRGVISMGKGFDFDVWLKWDTSKGTIKGTGKIQLLGMNLVVSETDC
jgi:hypothetical protein